MAVIGNRKASGDVVVIGPVSADTRQKLETATGRKTRKKDRDALVVAAPGDPRSAVDRVRDIVGEGCVVAPLLTDDDGNELIPTGGIQVRFLKEPSETALRRFKNQYQVKVSRRSKWEREQIEVEPEVAGGRFLLDLLDDIAADDEVAAAWPNVRAAYSKGDSA